MKTRQMVKTGRNHGRMVIKTKTTVVATLPRDRTSERKAKLASKILGTAENVEETPAAEMKEKAWVNLMTKVRGMAKGMIRWG